MVCKGPASDGVSVRIAFDIADFAGSAKMVSEVSETRPNFKYKLLNWFAKAATLNWVRSHTNIPLPRVWFYDANVDNAAGTPCMITDKVRDVAFERNSY